MPLKISIKDESAVKELALLRRGDAPGSFSDNKGGRNELYIFRCDGERSVISKSKGSVSLSNQEARAANANELETVKVLQSEECF